MLRTHLTQGPPPAWLRLCLPLLLLICIVALYQEGLVDVSAEIASDVVQRLSYTFFYQSKPKYSVPATIIREGNHDEYLAICLYVKNQAQDLPEFFQHHYYEMGIRRFYVMDDGSDPPMSTYVDKFGIPEEAVDFIALNVSSGIPQGTQRVADDQCAHIWGVNNTWIAYIDADEFFDTPGGETIEYILRNFETERPDVGALGVNWEMHTSSHQLYHADSVRQTYLECIFDDAENNNEASDSKHIKSIVRTDAYLDPVNPHKFNLKPGFITVGEHGDLVEHAAYRQPITRDRIALHHYVTKSFEDYADKITRSEKDWSFWNHVEYDLPHKACPQMLKYFPHTVNKDGYW